MTDLITAEILAGKNETIKSLMIQLQAMESHVKRTEAELAQARSDAKAREAGLREVASAVSKALHQAARDRDLTEAELAFMRGTDAALAHPSTEGAS